MSSGWIITAKRMARSGTRMAAEFIQGTHIRPITLFHNMGAYTVAKARADIMAGLNVALLAFPQGMAYALIAGLPVQYGIFGSAIAPIVAGLTSSSRLTLLGPTNATAVLAGSALMMYADGDQRLYATAMLTFMIGIFLVIAAFLKVATLTQYVSRTVVIGYITGAALFIMSGQLHRVLGIEGLADREDKFFYTQVWNTLTHLSQIDGATIALSVVTFSLLFIFKTRIPKWPGVAITLVIASVIGEFMFQQSWVVQRLNPVEASSWVFTPPKFDPVLFSDLLSSALAIAFLATLEDTFMAKSLAARTNERVDVNQEMLSVGVANVASGLFSGMPASGSLTRSALNWSSGAVTPVSGIFSGLVCGVTVLTLGYFIRYIPLCSLAVVVIFTAIALIQPGPIRIAMRSTPSDAAVFLLTFIGALVAPLNVAIFLGVAISIIFFLRQASSTQLVEYTFNEEGTLAELDKPQGRQHPQISIIHVEGELFFGAADLFRDQVRRVAGDANLKVIILRMRNARHLDATSVMALEELIRYVRETDRHLLISGATRDVYRVMRDSGMLNVLGRDNFFLGSPQNPNVSTRNALKRAQQLMGDQQLDIRIFVKSKNEEGGGATS